MECLLLWLYVRLKFLSYWESSAEKLQSQVLTYCGPNTNLFVTLITDTSSQYFEKFRPTLCRLGCPFPLLQQVQLRKLVQKMEACSEMDIWRKRKRPSTTSDQLHSHKSLSATHKMPQCIWSARVYCWVHNLGEVGLGYTGWRDEDIKSCVWDLEITFPLTGEWRLSKLTVTSNLAVFHLFKL